MSEQLPASEIIFSDTTTDGRLTITVWRDNTPRTDLMKEAGIEAMGILRIYKNYNYYLEHEERVPLSHSSVHGSGPTAEETDYWTSLVDKYLLEEE